MVQQGNIRVNYNNGQTENIYNSNQNFSNIRSLKIGPKTGIILTSLNPNCNNNIINYDNTSDSSTEFSLERRYPQINRQCEPWIISAKNLPVRENFNGSNRRNGISLLWWLVIIILVALIIYYFVRKNKKH